MMKKKKNNSTIIFAIAVFCVLTLTFPLFAQETNFSPLGSDNAPNTEGLPPDKAAEVQAALNETISQKNDTEEGQQDAGKKGYTVIEDEKGLPTRVINPDGTVVTYEYTLDENGNIVLVNLSSEGVEFIITKDATTIIGPGADKNTKSKPIVIMKDNKKEINKQGLANYGMINFRAIGKAFDELNNKMKDLKKKGAPAVKALTISKGKAVLSSNLKENSPQQRELNRALNKCYKDISAALGKSNLSATKLDKDSLTVEFILLLPKKK